MPAQTAVDALARGCRIIRRLVPPEAPWAATLARLDDGASCLLVDAALLDDWPGWAAPPGGHVLGPLDVHRTDAGHAVVLPLVTERVASFVDRRGGPAALAAGETVTLAVSVLRGLSELTDPASERGCWWLVDDGRPVFVHADGTVAEEDAEAAAPLAAILIRGLAEAGAGALADALNAAAELADDPRALPHGVSAAEAELFACAVPEPLATVWLSGASRRGVLAAASASVGTERPARSLPSRLLASIDADLGDMVSQAVTAVWRRWRGDGAPRHRRTPWLVAAGVAAAVGWVGMLWPASPAEQSVARPAATPDASGAAAASPIGAATPSSAAQDGSGSAPTAPAPAPSSPAEPSPAASDDPAAVARALLDARNACAAEPTCLADVMEDPARSVPAGIVDQPPSARRVALLDEFGGAAVLRVEPTSSAGAAQLVVIVETDGRWLLRDIHDVAEQP